uniref:Uncharacterized protein n=1 Tax=Glossina austeni TaxID=7395 RepID=A0A1A9UWL6_GLOAU
MWDILTSQRVRCLTSNSNFLNTVHSTRGGTQMLCTDEDDRTIRLWDKRKIVCKHFGGILSVLIIVICLWVIFNRRDAQRQAHPKLGVEAEDVEENELEEHSGDQDV